MYASADEFMSECRKPITPETIEAEFRNILQTHDVPPMADGLNSSSFKSNYTIDHNLHVNGSFKNNVVLRDHDDTFIMFPHQTIIISPVNLSNFWSTYEQLKTSVNVIIDSRLELIVMYAALAYADELIVYNSYTTKIMNLYDYCSDKFKIPAHELNIRQIQELFIMKMVISYYLHDCSIAWQVNPIITNLKGLHQYNVSGISKKSIIDIMMNYIKCGSIDRVNKAHVTLLYQLFHKYFSRDAYKYSLSPQSKTKSSKSGKQSSNDLIISKWVIKDLTLEEVYVTFMVLKQANFIFIKNDNM